MPNFNRIWGAYKVEYPKQWILTPEFVNKLKEQIGKTIRLTEIKKTKISVKLLQVNQNEIEYSYEGKNKRLRVSRIHSFTISNGLWWGQRKK